MKKTLFTLRGLALITCLAVTGVLLAQDAKPFVGTWEGAIDVAGQQIDIILEFSLEGDGLAGNIDVPAQGAEDIPLAEFKIEGKKITFMIDHPGVPGEPTFNGELDGAGTVLSGTFSQGGVEGTFEATRQSFRL
jgi:hypothetical protein